VTKYQPLIIYLVQHTINKAGIGCFIFKKNTTTLHYTMLIHGLGARASHRVKMYP